MKYFLFFSKAYNIVLKYINLEIKNFKTLKRKNILKQKWRIIEKKFNDEIK